MTTTCKSCGQDFIATSTASVCGRCIASPYGERDADYRQGGLFPLPYRRVEGRPACFLSGQLELEA